MRKSSWKKKKNDDKYHSFVYAYSIVDVIVIVVVYHITLTRKNIYYNFSTLETR